MAKLEHSQHLVVGLCIAALIGAVLTYVLGLPDVSKVAMGFALGTAVCGLLYKRLAPAVVLAPDLDLTEVARLRQRIEDFLTATPMGVLLIDNAGVVEFANAQVKTMLNLHTPLVGLRPLEVLPSVEIIEAIDLVRAKSHVVERQFSTESQDLAVSAHLAGSDVLVLLRDMTELRLAERARTDFVANVSHELRTPISAILGYAETVLDTPDLPEDIAKMVRVIERHGYRLHKLFEDLLTLHKLEVRREPLPRDVVDIGVVIRESIGVAQDRAARDGVGLQVEVDDSIVASCNRAALSAIIGNLASNAVKYTPAGGHVKVAAQVQGRDVIIRVTDTGVGIPLLHHARIFERFYRVDDGRARHVGGSGLGLAIVKHLADASGCLVSLEQSSSKGSTFSVRIPAEPSQKSPRVWDVTLKH